MVKALARGQLLQDYDVVERQNTSNSKVHIVESENRTLIVLENGALLTLSASRLMCGL